MNLSTWVLSRLLPNRQNQFQELILSLGENPENRRYLLAELNDLLAQAGKSELQQIMEQMPTVQLEPYTVNYIAAMIETVAHKLEMPVTGWVVTIPPLPTPVFASELMSLRLHLLTHSPPAFRRRNIFIDASIGDRV